LSIDRTQLNQQANPVSHLVFGIDMSRNGGQTWISLCAASIDGGKVLDDNGTVSGTSEVGCSLPDPGNSARMVRASLKVSGATATFAATITMT